MRIDFIINNLIKEVSLAQITLENKRKYLRKNVNIYYAEKTGWKNAENIWEKTNKITPVKYWLFPTK